jgi:excisionase family DNA binding protein
MEYRSPGRTEQTAEHYAKRKDWMMRKNLSRVPLKKEQPRKDVSLVLHGARTMTKRRVSGMGESNERSSLMMTRDEVAEQLQVSTKTVDNLWREDKLPRPSQIGRGVRFLRREIMQYIADSRM